jgi:prepilin-type processing-associated H-X9-DG protein
MLVRSFVLLVLVFAIPFTLLPGRESKPTLPPDLAALSGKGLVFATIRPAQLADGPIGKAIRAKLGKDLAQFEKGIREGVGLAPSEIERLSVFALAPKGEPIGAVAAVETLNKAKLVSTLLGTAEESKHAGKALFTNKMGNAVAFLGDKHYLFGRVAELKNVLDTKPESGPLSAALSSALEKNTGLVAVNAAQLKDMAGATPEAYKPLLEASAGMVTITMDETMLVKGLVKFADADAAKAGLEAMDLGKTQLLTLAEGALAMMAKEKESKAMSKTLGELLEQAKKVKFTSKGGDVSMEMSTKIDVSEMVSSSLLALQKTRQAAGRMQSANNLKQIALALHNYHDANGTLPAAAICDKDGKPLLSWRVAILPYIEQQALYDEFKLNEPWDSAHNKKLLAKMPKIYASPAGNAAESHTTFYQALVGESAGFNLRKGLKFTDFADGTSNTIVVAEGAKDVAWSKPEDPVYDGKTLPKLGGVFPQGFNVAFADGSVRFLTSKIKPATLKALITRNGGEVIGKDD